MIKRMLLTQSVWADQAAEDMLRKIDELYLSDTGIVAMTMEIVTPNWH